MDHTIGLIREIVDFGPNMGFFLGYLHIVIRDMVINLTQICVSIYEILNEKSLSND